MYHFIALLADTAPVYDNTQATEQFKDGMWSFWGPIFKWGFAFLCCCMLPCVGALAGFLYLTNQKKAGSTQRLGSLSRKPLIGRAAKPWPYQRFDFLLSRAEFSFYRVLQQTCGERFVVCPKVRLGDLLYVVKGTEKRMGWINKINRNHIDFVLCDPQTMKVVAAVELDDKSHDSEKARQRDADKDKACKDAGLPLLRFPAKRAYDPNAIAAELAKLSG